MTLPQQSNLLDQFSLLSTKTITHKNPEYSPESNLLVLNQQERIIQGSNRIRIIKIFKNGHCLATLNAKRQTYNVSSNLQSELYDIERNSIFLILVPEKTHNKFIQSSYENANDTVCNFIRENELQFVTLVSPNGHTLGDIKYKCFQFLCTNSVDSQIRPFYEISKNKYNSDIKRLKFMFNFLFTVGKECQILVKKFPHLVRSIKSSICQDNLYFCDNKFFLLLMTTSPTNEKNSIIRLRTLKRTENSEQVLAKKSEESISLQSISSKKDNSTFLVILVKMTKVIKSLFSNKNSATHALLDKQFCESMSIKILQKILSGQLTLFQTLNIVKFHIKNFQNELRNPGEKKIEKQNFNLNFNKKVCSISTLKTKRNSLLEKSSNKSKFDISLLKKKSESFTVTQEKQSQSKFYTQLKVEKVRSYIRCYSEQKSTDSPSVQSLFKMHNNSSSNYKSLLQRVKTSIQTDFSTYKIQSQQKNALSQKGKVISIARKEIELDNIRNLSQKVYTKYHSLEKEQNKINKQIQQEEKLARNNSKIKDLDINQLQKQQIQLSKTNSQWKIDFDEKFRDKKQLATIDHGEIKNSNSKFLDKINPKQIQQHFQRSTTIMKQNMQSMKNTGRKVISGFIDKKEERLFQKIKNSNNNANPNKSTMVSLHRGKSKNLQNRKLTPTNEIFDDLEIIELQEIPSTVSNIGLQNLFLNNGKIEQNKASIDSEQARFKDTISESSFLESQPNNSFLSKAEQSKNFRNGASHSKKNNSQTNSQIYKTLNLLFKYFEKWQCGVSEHLKQGNIKSKQQPQAISSISQMFKSVSESAEIQKPSKPQKIETLLEEYLFIVNILGQVSVKYMKISFLSEGKKIWQDIAARIYKQFYFYRTSFLQNLHKIASHKPSTNLSTLKNSLFRNHQKLNAEKLLEWTQNENTQKDSFLLNLKDQNQKIANSWEKLSKRSNISSQICFVNSKGSEVVVESQDSDHAQTISLFRVEECLEILKLIEGYWDEYIFDHYAEQIHKNANVSIEETDTLCQYMEMENDVKILALALIELSGLYSNAVLAKIFPNSKLEAENSFILDVEMLQDWKNYIANKKKEQSELINSKLKASKKQELFSTLKQTINPNIPFLKALQQMVQLTEFSYAELNAVKKF